MEKWFPSQWQPVTHHKFKPPHAYIYTAFSHCFGYSLFYSSVLLYAILYYTILYYTILYYTILYYTILYYTILYYTMATCNTPPVQSFFRWTESYLMNVDVSVYWMYKACVTLHIQLLSYMSLRLNVPVFLFFPNHVCYTWCCFVFTSWIVLINT